MDTRDDSLEGDDIGMRRISSKSSDDKGRHLSWLCLGDVRPHFEKLKGDGYESPTLNHVITDDSDDFTSDDEDFTVEACYESLDKGFSHEYRKQEFEETKDIPSSNMPSSSDWSIDVSTILAQHLVDYHHLSQAREINHVAIKMSEEVTSSSTNPTCTYTTFCSTESAPPKDDTSLPLFPSRKKRRVQHESNIVGRLPSEIKKQQRRCVVTLHTHVSVIPIPARDEYSPRARESMWSSFTEMARNIARNSIEFASEGWNWRSVIEDDDMLVHDVSGELIHPIHLRNALAVIGTNEDLLISNPLTVNGETTVKHVPLVLPPNID